MEFSTNTRRRRTSHSMSFWFVVTTVLMTTTCHGFSSFTSLQSSSPSSLHRKQQQSHQQRLKEKNDVVKERWARRGFNNKRMAWMMMSSQEDNDETETIQNKSPEEEQTETKAELLPPQKPPHNSKKKKSDNKSIMKRKMHLSWCGRDSCTNDEFSMRERVSYSPSTGRNDVEFEGPATGQVLFGWENATSSQEKKILPSVLLLVKRNDDDLMLKAASAVQNLTAEGVRVLLHPEHAAKLKHYFGVDNDDDMIKLFEPRPVPGFGGSHVAMDDLFMSKTGSFDFMAASADSAAVTSPSPSILSPSSDSSSLTATSPLASSSSSSLEDEVHPDLICTLGGDGLLMHVSMLFPGPAPPILCVAGGSLGFLTPFSKDEMCDAIFIALGVKPTSSSSSEKEEDIDSSPITPNLKRNEYSIPVDIASSVAPNGEAIVQPKKVTFGSQNAICLSMRMRLDCRVINREGVVRARFNVLNEVTIDRGSSPYLANLECFCDNVHLTTVQADGVIFATPTGSTAYSMAAGGSVVHPAVPAILVTPICPHVLSFRSMVLPDHVVLRCYVPDDARSDAIVAFDGKYRRELHRGDSVQVQMSVHPLPTINREDHSSDWLNSLKRNFNFNTRARQQPL